MFYYVYVLLENQKSLYVGFTKDLRRRIAEHKKGKVSSTKHRGPLKLIYYEAGLSKVDAMRRERYLKTTKGKRALRLRIRDYLS